jgi:hypothetical protein
MPKNDKIMSSTKNVCRKISKTDLGGIFKFLDTQIFVLRFLGITKSL